MNSLWMLHIVYPDHEIWTAEIEILLWPSLHQEQFIAFTERDTAAKHLNDTTADIHKPPSLYTKKFLFSLPVPLMCIMSQFITDNVHLTATIKIYETAATATSQLGTRLNLMFIFFSSLCATVSVCSDLKQDLYYTACLVKTHRSFLIACIRKDSCLKSCPVTLSLWWKLNYSCAEIIINIWYEFNRVDDIVHVANAI